MDGDVIYRTLLAEKGADSLVEPLPTATTRAVAGTVTMQGKATAVIGARRADEQIHFHHAAIWLLRGMA